MMSPGKWSEEQKIEVLRSSVGNAMINLKIVANSQLAQQLGLIDEKEREILLRAAEVALSIMKRGKEKGIFK
ncbi:MAG: hypothetical protein N3H84_07445 [Candidatus Caldarchaeum sp.]|nr:hypothetical protein [Candidatus Caldarchaeum sp.]MCX8201917.1 hypothetical protein [Candidatus Caldarchaeum sp.]MDW8435261.1 hypothetical protein [Candidatus Caldarchaeum sp.]